MILRSANGSQACVIDCEFSGRAFEFRTNETSDATVDGFAIINGGGESISDGGAVLVESSSRPTFKNCIFAYNAPSQPSSNNFGGGIYVIQSAGIKLEGCLFQENSATDGGAIMGASSGTVQIRRCVFVDNVAAESANAYGGALRMDTGHAEVQNSLFNNNRSEYGGAITTNNTDTQILNTTFVNNSVTGSGAVVFAKYEWNTVTLTNCILWNNDLNSSMSESSQLHAIEGASITLRHTALQNCDTYCALANNANTALDPLFHDEDGVDGIVGNIDDDLRLLSASPCLDAGTNGAIISEHEVDLNGAPRIQDGDGDGNAIVDMGAYERVADCNSNGITDESEIAAGSSPDCNNNGVPDGCDLASGTNDDCNWNGIPDDCDIASGTSFDCNSNGAPDDCDLLSGASFDCNTNGIPDVCDISSGLDGDCNTNGVPDSCDVEAGTSDDCNVNWIPDDCELAVEQALVPSTLSSIGSQASRDLFASDRSLLTYQDMVVSYGRPWPADTDQTPDITTNGDPASRLRALAALRTCASDSLLFAPVFHELYSFEMLLGNEAYTDALDPTIGLHGINASELGDLYCFQGAPGVGSLLVEELNLLRGRDLCPGGSCDPADWLNDTTYYPTYTGNDSLGNPGTTRAAIYNRMPPNAEGFSALAYQSNYGPDENYEAVLEQYPQGHGDAYGYYLTATTTYLDVLRGEPSTPDDGISLFADALINAQQTDTEQVQPDGSPDVPVAHQSVRNMANAMAAKARAGLRVVDLTFRRDYREDPEDPEHDQILEDTDVDRAWGTGDWARRAGLGAYLDWAITSQLTPAGTNGMLGEVNRNSVEAISELASTASKLQERIDTAGGGLNPLGLVSNVVPFGINAGQLDAWIQSGSGKSHYEQVRDAAVNALANARSVLEYANQASQRMREQDESLFQFSEQVADRAADFQNRLIELHGYPSASDPADNDLDPTTSDAVEANSAPDLVNYLLDAQAIQEAGWLARPAPGEIQLAMSELRLAGLRIESAQNELDNLRAETDDLTRFIEFREGTQAEEIDIINQATQETIALAERVKQMQSASLSAGSLKKAVKSAVKSARGGSYTAMYASALLSAAQQSAQINANFEMQVEQARISGWKEAELTQISQKVEIERERLRLQSLVRQSPQLMVNLKIAEEHALQATGRLHAAVQRGQRLLDERERIRRLQRDQLESYRWEDLAFRVFRNNAIQKYDAFFDVAARFVMLAGRSFAYEYNERSIYDLLERVCSERRLGNDAGTSGGIQGVLEDLDQRAITNQFNSPFIELNEKTFRLRSGLLGLSNSLDDNLAFRAWLESHIVQRLEDLPVMQDYAQLSSSTHFGPAIVIPLATENTGNNFFGNPPEVPFGGDRFPISRNAKILRYAIRFDGVDAFALGGSNDVSVFLMPIGDSVIRENTNQPVVEDEPARSWSVVDQWLPLPPLVSGMDPNVQDRDYNPWVETAGSGSNYLNAVKRFLESTAQIEAGQALAYQVDRAGRSAWNTEWLLVIPGAQWTGSSDPDVIHDKLMTFIYGAGGDPANNLGITDIRWIVSAYAN
jgi:hypothetical protein